MSRTLRGWRPIGRAALAFGVLDAGLNSLGTFLVGLFAARVLDASMLGAYALAFYALFLAAVIPTQLLFVPAEVVVVSFDVNRRLGLLSHTIRLGLAPALVSAMGVGLWILAAPAGVPGDAVRALTVTAMMAALFSPIQDHVRRMLHMGGASSGAVLVSGVQIGAVTGILVAFTAAGVPAWWTPLGALAAANLLSMLTGLAIAHRRARERATAPELRYRALMPSGRWLLFLGLLEPGMAFVAAVVVSRLAGSAALGHAEAARIVGHPLLVLAWGLSAVLGPLSVRAAQEGAQHQARRVSRIFFWTITGVGLAALLVFGTDWDGNLLKKLLPTAYAVPGLVAATIVAHLVTGISWPFRSELIGGRREAALAGVEATANLFRLVVAATAGVTHAFAIPFSTLASGLVRWVGFHVPLRGVYAAGVAGRGAPPS